MNRFRWLVLLAVVAIASCASAPPLKMAAGAQIAVASFALSNSIVHEGEKPDSGPGLLNNRADYYKPYQDAVDGGWDTFKNESPQVFGKVQLLDFATVEGSAELQKATYVPSNIVLGKDISPSGQWVFPKNLNYISESNKNLIVQAGKILTGADYLMLITQEATYQLNSGIQLGPLTAGNAKMHVVARVFLYRPSGELAWNWIFDGNSSETAPLLGNALDPKNYRLLLISAEEDWLRQFKTKVQDW